MAVPGLLAINGCSARNGVLEAVGAQIKEIDAIHIFDERDVVLRIEFQRTNTLRRRRFRKVSCRDVSEFRELLLRVRIGRRFGSFRYARGLLTEVLQLIAHGIGNRGPFRCEVVIGVRVGRVVVKFPVRGLYVQILSCAQGLQRAPAPGTRIIGLRVSRPIAPNVGRNGTFFSFRLHKPEQRSALHFFWYLDPGRLQDGWHDVDEFGAVFNSFPGSSLVGKFDQERHADGFIVKKNSVRIFAMRSERLAMIGHDGDDRAVVETSCF